jgi:hypothetical protein
MKRREDEDEKGGGKSKGCGWKDSDKEEDEIVSKSLRTVRLERELQMMQLSGTRCSCVPIL